MQPLPADGPVITLDDLLAAGYSIEQVKWQVSSGRWQRPFRGVYVTFSGPIPTPLYLEAAIRYAGSGSASSHTTAGAFYGFCRPTVLTHVTVPGSRQVAKQPGLVIHRSRTLDETVGSPPRTTPERTVCDLLGMTKSADRALALVADAVRSRRTTSSRLREAIAGTPNVRWRAVCLDVMPEVAGGAHSLLELKDSNIRRRHRLPRGKRQKRRDAGGVEYLDVVIEEYAMHVELDGRAGHDRAEEEWRDMRRDNRSEVLRLRHLRYGWADLVHRPCQVAIEQAVVLRQQGWRGRFSRCPDCPRDLPPEL